MTVPQTTCLSCHRRTESTTPRCRHHNNLSTHLLHGFPMPALDIEDVPHAKARHQKPEGTVLVIHRLPVTSPTPCQRINPELFFEDYNHLDHSERRDLAHMCRTCPIIEHCREIAIAHQEHGFQGGMTPNQRASIRTLRGQLLTNLIGPLNQHPEYRHGHFIKSGT